MSLAVDGNFDDTQTGVKRIFSDSGDLAARLDAEGTRLLLRQFHQLGPPGSPDRVLFLRLCGRCAETNSIRCGDPVNFAVPTGNFGNILAAWYARSMGLPVGRLLCASNDNNVLSDFLNSGVYNRNRPFHKTASPSMDILISSNLERLLYEVSGRDAGQVSEWMSSLAREGCYDVGGRVKQSLDGLFHGGWADGEATLHAILETWQSHRYVADTHTAVAIDVWKRYVEKTADRTPTVVVSTASPFKFSDHVVGALSGGDLPSGLDEFGLLRLLSEKTGWPIPKGLAGLEERPVLHTVRCGADTMRDTVVRTLGLHDGAEGGSHA
jgi:threonine synthase